MSVRRRGNGLNADSYVLLVDLDPRLADPLLAALATAGVAAYTTPSPGRTGPLFEPHLPSRPLEAIHVDSRRRPEARRVLETTTPEATVGLPTVEEEDQFAALVAGWDDEPDVRDWPAAEEVEEEPLRPPRPPGLPGDGAGPPRRRRTDQPTAEVPPADAEADVKRPDEDEPPSATAEPAPASPPAEPAAAGPVDEPDAPKDAETAPTDLPDDGFTPPRLGAMPPAHPVTKWGIVALGLGLILLIFPMLLGLEHTNAVDVAGVLTILGGVGLLVSRLSDRSTDEYEGPDDGAVV